MTQMNFLPEQYHQTEALDINHNYLQEQFSDFPTIFKKIEQLVQTGDYTLGKEVDLFEQKFAQVVGSRYALGVGSGTDALFLSLKAIDIGPGDEVITTPYTFFATIGAIVTAGARPIFVDVQEDYNINPENIEKAITPRTKAILPVHWSGLPCDMTEIMKIANRHGLKVVEDACHAIQATYRGQGAGSFGVTGCFSMHPLKNLNVWGDGGVVVTQDEKIYRRISLMRNHGLMNRNECEIFAYNSRLDTLQAIVANHVLEKISSITASRIRNSTYFDENLSSIPQIQIPTRSSYKKQVFHIYVIRAERRDELQKDLIQNGIDAKIHYPIPMHLQPAARAFGYRKGDFPVCESICDSVISLPVHEFITRTQQDHVIERIRKFYQ